ncbi:MAG: tRNA (adenosine(37)-N6)-dimethylallyltransferase MiaA [Saprospiraceae bacterium]
MENHNTNKRNFLITISGPTAVGKTDVVIKLAKKYKSDIFNADSRQLYKEMNIGTAKPTTQERMQSLFYFVDCQSVKDGYNAGQFEKDFRAQTAKYFNTNDIGIMCGGTGLYIKAALEGLDDFPTVVDSYVTKLEDTFNKNGLESLSNLLKKLDPEYAKTIDIDNSRRVIRALSVIDVEDKPYSYYINQNSKKKISYSTLNICLVRDRQELYNRINQRVDKMIDVGLVDEVKSLLKYKDLRALDTVGYREIFEYLDGKISLERAIELIKRNTRRYAKRQMTWYKNQGEWLMINAEDWDGLVEKIDVFVNPTLLKQTPMKHPKKYI